MKPEEKQLTRWLDGEGSKPLDESLVAQAKEWERLRPALREQLSPPAFKDSAFLRSRVEQEIARAQPPAYPTPTRLVAWGLGALAAATVLTLILLPQGPNSSDHEAYLSRVIEAEAGLPGASVVAFKAPKGRGVVLWIEGAGYIPPEENVR